MYARGTEHDVTTGDAYKGASRGGSPADAVEDAPARRPGRGAPAGQTAQDRAEAIRTMVDTWPPLSERQRQDLALLLRPAHLPVETD